MANLNEYPETVKELSEVLLEIIEQGGGDSTLWFDGVCPVQLSFTRNAITGKIDEVSFEKYYVRK